MEDQRLIKALKSEPEFRLKDDFADKVILRVKEIESAQFAPSFRQYLIPALIFLTVSVVSLLVFFEADLAKAVADHYPWIILTTGLILVFQYLDKKILGSQKTKTTYTFSGSPQ